MGNFITTIKNISKIEDLKNRILVTLSFLLIYRFGSYIPLPGIDISQLSALEDRAASGLLGLLNAFTGGAFAKASILALGIMPYISASIVVQLSGIIIPSFQKMQREGESGRKRINQITRFLTILICLIQGPTYITTIKIMLPEEAILLSDTMFWVLSIVILVTGTVFAMWLGEKITDKGIGNGISLLITVGIIAHLPQAFMQEFVSKMEHSNGGLVILLLELAIWLVVIAFSIMLVQAVRRVPVQYAKRSVSGAVATGGVRQYIPLKVNSSGVMPIIFAQAIMFLPMQLFSLSSNDIMQKLSIVFRDIHGLWYSLLFAFLIIMFTYFYTAITVPATQMSDDMKRNGGFIPGIKPGMDTSQFLDKVMSRITLPGALFLAFIAILPSIVVNIGITQSFAMFYGGTSLLIMVGVVLDTLQQVNSYLLNHHYDGLMRSGRLKGRITDINL
ncbi:preprotein translocase subunit SecY [Ichthyobacterium seriolicida]|uniref:Protein translocase subunit SecY n=1 Tax=Ichthyobacterium seriolicida TaxID=242600 RepID=A0A1J1E453_9FLAO|nr:preprotein translocase subunit SecY [Ichthyobacterium seriolicida]BAV94828.1 preprotein translocase secY subunit [Ichthyobacterium seriolicida]